MTKIQKLHKLKLAWIFRLKAFVEADFELEIKKKTRKTHSITKVDVPKIKLYELEILEEKFLSVLS